MDTRLNSAQDGPKAPAAAGQGLFEKRLSPTLYLLERDLPARL